MYSGHKRTHGLKFQMLTTLDGIIACLFGPINGNRHDSFMLCMSGLLAQLQEIMPLEDGIVYAVYGDPAYPRSDYIKSGYRNPVPGYTEAQYNTIMSASQICAEWSYRDITQNFKWLSFENSLHILQCPVVQYYTIAAFLTKLCSIFMAIKHPCISMQHC